ncbi:MAG: hypothetical protein ACK4R7_03260 [Fervidobacterium sp.]
MRINTLAIVFLILLLILFIDIFSSNYFSSIIHSALYKLSEPAYNLKNALENTFRKEYINLNVTLFGNEKADLHEVLSIDEKGIYVRNLANYGIVVSASDGKFIGFVEKTGKVGYVTKWWEKSFPVTIESSENFDNLESVNSIDYYDVNNSGNSQSDKTTDPKPKIVGYYNKYNIEIPDPLEIYDGTVYLSEYVEYGKLLKEFRISIGEYKDGILRLNIPSIPRYVILLEKYDTNGGK